MTISQASQVVLFKPQGSIDLQGGMALSEHMAEVAPQPDQLWVIDLADVDFMDSSGIGVILGRYKEIIARGGELIACHVTSPVDRLFTMAGLYKIIRSEKNEELALLSLGVAS